MSIIASPTPVTLMGGSGCRTEEIEIALSLAPRLVAADGGADSALMAGYEPEAVIGDLDSLSEAAAERLSGRLHQIAEQDSTDFDKALRSIDAPVVIAVGFTGGRLDHELAVMSALVTHADRACIVAGPETLVFHCPERLVLDLTEGTLVSLFPLLPVTVRSEGLRWELDDLALVPGGRIGTSNEARGGPISVRPGGPGLLVILETTHLEAAVRAVSAEAVGARARVP